MAKTTPDTAAAAPAAASAALPRIEPRLDADGQPVYLLPPCGGSWVRDADGGLTPADEATAIAAGLLPAPAQE